MLRSLHLKLMLIMLLLITSLMTVVGAFLITNVSSFYTNSFYEQMKDVFDEEFILTLRTEAERSDGVTSLQRVIEANSGSLGIDSHSRNYYILDAATGVALASSDVSGTSRPADTANLLAARSGEVGQRSDITANYMDVAIPISGNGSDYIVYILDNRETVSNLNSQLFMIILQALLIGLLISVLLSFLLSKTMTLPIERLTNSAERMAAGDFSSRISVESNDEIGILTTTFNEMSDVLQTTLEEVKNERNKLDTLFLHMTDGVVAFARDHTIIQYNPAAAQMLRAKDLSKLRYDDFFQSQVDFDHILALHSPFYEDCEYTVDDTTLEVHLTPFSGENSGGVMAVLHDVTRQRRDEAIRREFVANVSHELRTPLTAIAGYAETLRDSAAEDPSICAKFAETILRNAQHMGTMVEDLLKLSRIESGAVPMEMETVKAASILSDVTTACQPQTAAHNLTLETDIDPALTVRADPHFIGQVFRNLIENACRYAPEGSTIKVSGGKRLDHNGLPEALFMICDDGPGIPQADIARVFERFYRVEKHRSSPASTGLGLAICKHIVERHGGRIWAEPGPGGCLQFTLPLAAETEKRT